MTPVTARWRVVTAAGVACWTVVLLSPALLPDEGDGAVTAAVLPLGFLGAGVAALLLRPGHRVGAGLLAVGVLHLGAFATCVASAVLRDLPAVAVPIGALSAALFAMGFVALLDLLARYPTGQFAWPFVPIAVRGAAAVALGIVAPAVLADERAPSVLGLDAGANPWHLPALAPLTGAPGALLLLPLSGLVLLAVRYPRSPSLDRAQLRWPLVTTAVLVAALATTGAVEGLVGAEVQTAVFVSLALAFPAAFLVGLLRHADQTERLAAVAASRARLVEVADAERRRIERDLHDGAQQQLLALLTRVSLVRTQLAGSEGDVDAELCGIADDVRQVHRELRELARGIHPAVLTDRGLSEAVRSALTRLPLHAELEVSAEVERTRYEPAVEAGAYFLVLEALSNVVQHAEASSVRVTIGCRGGVLDVAVTDDGRGMPPAGVDGGLVGLRDRVGAVGGELDVQTGAGVGTVVRGRLPVGDHVVR
jgi:signal transduction histidine kinase